MPRSILALLLLPMLAFAQTTPPPAPQPNPRALKPGQFLWHPEIAPEGPIVLVVSLDEQRAYVYRNGIAIGVSTISSGKPGKDTPTGVFTILQKSKDHKSTIYDSAPMPYMQRLTWDGIALHAGHLPGYPASHGCVRLPLAFAQQLFAETRTGDTVVVANAKAASASLVYPALLAPVDHKGAETALVPDVLAGYYWDDAKSTSGPVSVLVSIDDKRVYVLRNGVTIAEGGLSVAEGFHLDGSVLMAVNGRRDGTALGAAQWQWSAYPILGVDADSVPVLQMQLQEHALQVDAEFARRIFAILEPGSTVLLSDLPGERTPVPAAAPEPVLESDDN